MIAAITGGGRGIGRVIAQTLAKADPQTQVIVLSRSQAELDETVALIGSQARAMILDVVDAAAVTRVFAEIGAIDLLINNAGDGGPVGPFEQGDATRWWRTQEVNLLGPVLCSQAVLPGMIARRSGRIINMSSAAANMSAPYFSSYVTSKAALNKFTECLAAEMKAHGVGVFSMSPGPVHTAMSAGLANSEEGKKWLPWFPKVLANAVPADFAATLVLKIAAGEFDDQAGQMLMAT
jgi:NAD(P)-dependent dehydrogenase (short-subunit alcohol dehydrogenase family)